MIDQSFRTALPDRWWTPAARPQGGAIDKALFWSAFVAGLPFAVVGYYRFSSFRFVGRIGEILGKARRSPVHAVMPKGLGEIEFPVLDRFWSRLAFRTYRYETELDRLIEAAGDDLDIFVDGGANIGLWSVAAAGRAHKVVAVEASPATLSLLEANRERNHDRFSVYRRALWSVSGEQLSFSWNPTMHAGASLTDVAERDTTAKGWSANEVETIAIDDLLDDTSTFDGAGAIILKLDVEGAEMEVLAGARRALDSDRTIIVYEEHGRESEHAVTEALLAEGFSVHYLENWGLRSIHSASDVQAVTRRPWMGYNFIAARPGGRAEEVVENLDPLRMRRSAASS